MAAYDKEADLGTVIHNRQQRVATSYSLTIEAVIRNVFWPKTGGLSTAIQVGASDPEDVRRPWNPLVPAINFALLRQDLGHRTGGHLEMRCYLLVGFAIGMHLGGLFATNLRKIPS